MQDTFNVPGGLVITEEADWNLFPTMKLDVIVDSMVFRSGELLLLGRSGVQQLFGGTSPDFVWEALSQNIGSLAAFCDALILNEHLPIIDYGPSYGSSLLSNALFQYCNQNEGILIPIHVEGNAFVEAHQDAIIALAQRKQLPPELVTTVRAQLSAFGYDWKPYIPGEELLLSEEERALSRFLFGGLLFSAYAQRTGAAHLIQPQRSKLYLEASLTGSLVDYGNEEALLAEMKKRIKQVTGPIDTTYDIDILPPFLPYLLKQDPETPADLLKRALALRHNGAVRDYRDWRAKLIRDWRDYGRIDLAYEKDVKKLTQAVLHEIEIRDGPSPEIAIKATLFGLVPVVEIGMQSGLPLSGLWGWFAEKLPGRRHSKLLMRMSVANHAYTYMNRHLRNIWSRA